MKLKTFNRIREIFTPAFTKAFTKALVANLGFDVVSQQYICLSLHFCCIYRKWGTVKLILHIFQLIGFMLVVISGCLCGCLFTSPPLLRPQSSLVMINPNIFLSSVLLSSSAAQRFPQTLPNAVLGLSQCCLCSCLQPISSCLSSFLNFLSHPPQDQPISFLSPCSLLMPYLSCCKRSTGLVYDWPAKLIFETSCSTSTTRSPSSLP